MGVFFDTTQMDKTTFTSTTLPTILNQLLAAVDLLIWVVSEFAPV